MKQRQRREQYVALGEAGDRRPGGRRDPQHTVHREPHAFGAAGRAGGVEDEGRVVQRRRIARRRFGRCGREIGVAQRRCIGCAAVGRDQGGKIVGGGLKPRVQIGALGGGDDRLAVRISESVRDFRFGRVVTDRDADGAGPRDRQAAFDPFHRVRQRNRDGVADRNTAVGKVPGKSAGALGQYCIGD